MQYKLLIVKNRYNKKLNIDRGLQWFKEKTPLEVVVADTIVTDFDVIPKKVGNASIKGDVYTVSEEDLVSKLKPLVPEGKYHCVVFVYGNKMPGIRVGYASRLPLYPGTDLINLDQASDGGWRLNHEIFHTFFHRLQRQQIVVTDPMDQVMINGKLEFYYHDRNIKAKISNRTIALDTLAPHWQKVENILILKDISDVVTITRGEDNGWQTTGKLDFGHFKCYTLEKPWSLNMKKVSCIPKGTYKARYSFSPKFLKYTYEILNVPNRTGIRIHSGNFFFDIEGCILLGDSYKDVNNDGKVDILNSKNTVALFEKIMNKRDFTLIIQ